MNTALAWTKLMQKEGEEQGLRKENVEGEMVRSKVNDAVAGTRRHASLIGCLVTNCGSSKNKQAKTTEQETIHYFLLRCEWYRARYMAAD